MKHIFILNSFTLRDKCEYIKERIIRYCNDKLIDFVIEVNDENYSTEEIVNKYKDDEYIIFAVGGDGVINRVLNCIVNTKNILGFIPFGTGNDFYRTVKLQCTSGINDIDLIKINDKYFLNVGCFGIDADIANDSTVLSKKTFLKKYKYIINLIKHFLKYNAREMSVNINGKIIKSKFTTIAICNGMFYGRGFNIGPNSLLNDGLVDIYIVNELNRFKMLNLILKMKKGKHEYSNNVEKYSVKSLSINSKNYIKCNIDGEELEDKEFKIKVLSNKQKIYYNEDIIKSLIN